MIIVSSYDGEYVEKQVFNRSYKISLEDCKIKNGYLELKDSKINLENGKVEK